jgi:hypothetical protein
MALDVELPESLGGVRLVVEPGSMQGMLAEPPEFRLDHRGQHIPSQPSLKSRDLLG